MTATEEQPAVVQTDTGNLDNDPDFNAGLNRMADKFDQLMVPIREREKAKEGADQSKPDKLEKPEKPSETKAKETAQPEKLAAETTASVETPTEGIEEPDKRWSKATQENWNHLRTIKNEAIKKEKDRADALDRRVKELESTAQNSQANAEVKALKDQIESLTGQLERVSLENSPRFKSYYDGNIEKQLRLAKAAAGKHGEEVVKLLQQPSGQERNERLAEIKTELGIEGDVISHAIAEIRKLNLEREEQLANHRDGLKKLREQEQIEAERSKEQTLSQRKNHAERIVQRARSVPELKPEDGDEEHAAFADGAMDFIRNASLGSLDADDSRLLPVSAMVGLYYKTIKVPRMEKELQQLRDTVQKLQAAGPKMDGSNRSEKDTEIDTSQPLDFSSSKFLEKYNKAMGR